MQCAIDAYKGGDRRPRLRLRQGAVLVVPIGLILSACGGGVPGPRPLSKADLVQQVKAICQQAGQPYRTAPPTDPREYATFLHGLIPSEDRGLHALEALRPPSDQVGEWTARVITPERQQLADARTLASALDKADATQGPILVQTGMARLDQRGAQINGYWTQLGISDCMDSPL